MQQSPLIKFKAGELVRVMAHNDRALGLAYVNPRSLIAARLLQTWKIPDAAWFEGRLRAALRLRERLYPEALLSPGVRRVRRIAGLGGRSLWRGLRRANRDGRHGAAQTADSGGAAAAFAIAKRCSSKMTARRGNSRACRAIRKPPLGAIDDPAVVIEDGLEFRAPLASGPERPAGSSISPPIGGALQKYVRKGARVLDVFSYVGAWGVRAAASGAREVVCVDSSAAALEFAAANAERNGVGIAARRGDAFDVLEDLAKQGERFDVVIIDPPAFAKRKKDLPKALAAYKRLNQLAIQVLADDGILVSCSCSFHVSAEDLREAIAKAARGADRQLQIIETGGQAPDHPVHPAIPETQYLKAYFCRISDSLK